MSRLPHFLLFAAAGYLSLLGYSDYTLRNKKTDDFLKLSQFDLDISQILKQPDEDHRVLEYLGKCEKALKDLKDYSHFKRPRVLSNQKQGEDNGFTGIHNLKQKVVEARKNDIITTEREVDFWFPGLKLNAREHVEFEPKLDIKVVSSKGRLGMNERIDLSSKCFKLCTRHDMLLYCIEQTQNLQQKLKMQVHREFSASLHSKMHQKINKSKKELSHQKHETVQNHQTT